MRFSPPAAGFILRAPAPARQQAAAPVFRLACRRSLFCPGGAVQPGLTDNL